MRFEVQKPHPNIYFEFYEILYSGSIDETDSSDDDILPTNPQTCEIIKQKIVRVVTGGYGGAAMAATFKITRSSLCL